MIPGNTTNHPASTQGGDTRYHILVILAGAVFFTFSSLMELFRLSVFDPNRDTIIFNQALWTTIHYGELLYNSPEAASHFGTHFSPIIFSVLPIYFLAPGPHTLFLFQSVLVTLGAVPIYLCAREVLGSKIGCMITLTYFLYPNLHGIGYFDFYETTFLPLILGFVLWAYLTGRQNLMLVSCITALLVKEDVSLIIITIAGLALWTGRSRPVKENWRYLLLIGLSLLVLISFFLVIKPAFSYGDPHAANQFLDQYRDIPGNLADNNGKRIYYLVQLLTPLLFVPFAAPQVLFLAVPSLLEILLSPSSMYHFVGQHYTAPVIPILFMSLIMGLKRINNSSSLKRFTIFRNLPYLILFCTGLSALYWSPYVPPLQYALEGEHLDTWDHGPVLHATIERIPEDIPLAAPMHILPFLTNRHDLFLGYSPDAEIILLDAKLPEFSEDFQDHAHQIEQKYIKIHENEGVSLYVRSDREELISLINQRMSK